MAMNDDVMERVRQAPSTCGCVQFADGLERLEELPPACTARANAIELPAGLPPDRRNSLHTRESHGIARR